MFDQRPYVCILGHVWEHELMDNNEYPLAQLRAFMLAVFSDEEVDTLCFDHFMEVYEGFAATFTKNQKVMKLISHCQMRNQMASLVSVLQTERSDQFTESFPELLANQEKAIQIQSLALSLEEDDDIGFLDLLDEAEIHSTTMVESAHRLTTLIDDVGKDMSLATTELNNLLQGPNPPSRREAKRVLLRAAERIDVFAEKVELETPLFARSLIGGLSALQRSEIFLDEFPDHRHREERIDDVLNSLDIVEGAIISAHPSTKKFTVSILSLPRITKEINKSKRRAASAVEQLVQEFESSLLFIKEIRQRFQQLRSDPLQIEAHG